jgi:hypothetical protein
MMFLLKYLAIKVNKTSVKYQTSNLGYFFPLQRSLSTNFRIFDSYIFRDFDKGFVYWYIRS